MVCPCKGGLVQADPALVEGTYTDPGGPVGNKREIENNSVGLLQCGSGCCSAGRPQVSSYLTPL